MQGMFLSRRPLILEDLPICNALARSEIDLTVVKNSNGGVNFDERHVTEKTKLGAHYRPRRINGRCAGLHRGDDERRHQRRNAGQGLVVCSEREREISS